ncbi:hypothetical protein [Haloarcula sp. Atlit-7R]|uniref:hypothetical protein n=1 Tax=Haloarcula sp. Atlit-7R TaxID=2282125 RepID=UPI000EF14C66|nr:hypothetical protein [Haloarcula sp. Atlit-7R]RLM89903.1 hypothetical protein D3D01_18490 [Haloarcula sp. Atlit-7R]
MSETARFRFGKIDLPENERPDPEELHTAIDDTFRVRSERVVVEGEDPVELEEKGSNPYLSTDHDEFSFCYFYYISDKEDSQTVRDGDELTERRSEEVVQPRVFYFQNGMFAYESEQGLVKHWIPNYIGERTEVEVAGNYDFYDFPQEMMKDFYDSRDHISVFRFGAPEDGEFEGDSPLAQALNELTEDVESQEFSGGNSERNLKGVSIVDEAAEKMKIEKLHGSIDDGYTNQILASGVYVPVWSEKEWPSDVGADRRAETIFRKLGSTLRKLE